MLRNKNQVFSEISGMVSLVFIILKVEFRNFLIIM
jgi:hypothetical protein